MPEPSSQLDYYRTLVYQGFAQLWVPVKPEILEQFIRVTQKLEPEREEELQQIRELGQLTFPDALRFIVGDVNPTLFGPGYVRTEKEKSIYAKLLELMDSQFTDLGIHGIRDELKQELEESVFGKETTKQVLRQITVITQRARTEVLGKTRS